MVPFCKNRASSISPYHQRVRGWEVRLKRAMGPFWMEHRRDSWIVNSISMSYTKFDITLRLI